MKNNVEKELLNHAEPILNNINFFHIFISLSQIILLILVLSWIIKKISFIKRNKSNSNIKIIEKISLGSNEFIVLAEVKEVQLILGVTKNNITHLYTFISKLKKNELSDK
ncbi:Flagellar protein FliO [Buchnera aphidicola (Protaphis terricola)]|uniref:flagellar biosynthetic protein FliO n=1 Tax=Buchnera aphidicola TaxID=9 RepID=UPI003463E601